MIQMIQDVEAPQDGNRDGHPEFTSSCCHDKTGEHGNTKLGILNNTVHIEKILGTTLDTTQLSTSCLRLLQRQADHPLLSIP